MMSTMTPTTTNAKNTAAWKLSPNASTASMTDCTPTPAKINATPATMDRLWRFMWWS